MAQRNTTALNSSAEHERESSVFGGPAPTPVRQGGIGEQGSMPANIDLVADAALLSGVIVMACNAAGSACMAWQGV